MESVPIPTGDALLPKQDDFLTKFNKSDFMFDHGLAHHPLFDLPALAALAQRIPHYKDFVYWQNGRINVNDKWGANPAKRLSLDETIMGIAHNDSLVILKHAEQDPIFGPVLQEILQRMYSFASPAVQSDIILGESLIFINSPNRKTPYHLDMEASFLLQIRGEKQVYAFDSTDRGLTPHSELENQACGDGNGAIYKPERQGEAHHYKLTAGHGVHFPSLGPHWVQNADEVSLSVNINFDLRSIHGRMKRIYRVNRMLRRLGIEPAAPGASAVGDAMKETVGGVGATLKSLTGVVKKRHPLDSYPVWRPNPVARQSP